MGKIRLSLGLMLLTALLVMVGGMRLARRTVVERMEVDRAQLMAFSAKLTEQLKSRDLTFVNERRLLASKIYDSRNGKERDFIRNDPAARSAYLFKNGRLSREFVPLPDKPLPEVFLSGKKFPLNPDRAIVFPEEFFKDLTYGDEGVIGNKSGEYELFWYSPLQGDVVAIVYEVEAVIRQYILAFSQEALDFRKVITQHSLSTVISDSRGHHFHHPEALPRQEAPTFLTPHESAIGTIWLKDWDEVRSRSITHKPTIWSAAGLALALITAGLFLYFSQTRSLRESQERVSFVNRVTHELGTPLTNMTLNLELAARSLRSQPEAAGRRLEKVREEVGRLSRLVKNVLRHSSDQTTTVASTCIDPNEVIVSVISQFRPALERRKIVIEWRPAIVTNRSRCSFADHLESHLQRREICGCGKVPRSQYGMFRGPLHTKGSRPWKRGAF